MEPSGKDVLEIGCGTGQATLPLAERGCNVAGVEMGENLARMARSKVERYPNVRIVTARFEDWDPRGASFDMVFAATAWHWLDPRLRYWKAAQVLRPAGVLAFTSGGHAFPPGFDPFFTQIHACYKAIGKSEWSGRLRRPTRFQRPPKKSRAVVILMSTASDHRLMDPAKREWLFAEMRRLINARPGGRVQKHKHVARLAERFSS